MKVEDDLYNLLGVSFDTSYEEIKSAYRALVKLHHPDRGDNSDLIISINAAWEILGDPEKRAAYDKDLREEKSKTREKRNSRAINIAQEIHGQGAVDEKTFSLWIEKIYSPIDKYLGGIINPLSARVKDLSADPYDDQLMDDFCSYIETSKSKLKRIETLYSSLSTPRGLENFSLRLYYCLSQVKDGINELERYTMGYVDNYLHDGKEMIRKAKRIRLELKEERHRLY